MEKPRANSRAISSPADLKWVKDGNVEDHVRFLLDAKHYVAGQDVPEDYRQWVHSDAGSVGDPRTPSIVDASYEHGMSGRHLVSLAYPDFTPAQEMIEQLSDGTIRRPTGFTHLNMKDSFEALLKNQGVRVLDGGKIGPDRLAETIYIEFDVHPDDYEKGRKIINFFLHSNETNPSTFLRELNDIANLKFSSMAKPLVPSPT